jgi:synaptobrevin family protein YKT6
MMRLVGVYVIQLTEKTCRFKDKLDFISVLSRSSVRELMHEFAISAAESLIHPERKIFEHNEFQFICQRWEETSIILVTDHEYPSRVAFDILRQLFEDPSDSNMASIIETRQDGQDIISRVSHSLEETMVIAHENIDRVIQRGEDIDKLVEKSERLSNTSKMFYKVARKHNSCCIVS